MGHTSSALLLRIQLCPLGRSSGDLIGASHTGLVQTETHTRHRTDPDAVLWTFRNRSTVVLSRTNRTTCASGCPELRVGVHLIGDDDGQTGECRLPTRTPGGTRLLRDVLSCRTSHRRPGFFRSRIGIALRDAPTSPGSAHTNPTLVGGPGDEAAEHQPVLASAPRLRRFGKHGVSMSVSTVRRRHIRVLSAAGQVYRSPRESGIAWVKRRGRHLWSYRPSAMLPRQEPWQS